MRERRHTEFCLLLAALVLCLFPMVKWSAEPVQETWVEVQAPGPTMTHAERSEKIRSTILSLAEKHNAPGGRERLRLLADTIYQESLNHELDPLLVAAMISMESSFRPSVVSDAGAVGLMQLRPFVARDVAERNDLLWSEEITLVEPHQNVRLGVMYYREMVDRFHGNERLALIAYNRGPTRLRSQMRRGGDTVASRYAENVLSLYYQLCEDCGLLQA